MYGALYALQPGLYYISAKVFNFITKVEVETLRFLGFWE